MTITVDGKEYMIEYTFEAAHNKKCVDLCWNYFSGAYMMKGAALDELGDSETVNKVATIDKMIDTMSDIPDMVITLLYAGLLEHHEDEIQTGKDARNLYKRFCKENPDDERTSDFTMFEAIKAQMEEDGFFKRIGLENFLEQLSQPNSPKKTPKTPQNHQRKTADRSGK
ncbi:hypothetical protein RO787_28390 [Blautia coccoides]|uniref:hypothetical protein n=1 Tax=Blautia producta TaxID=33035 RepID=UPI0028A447BD|nr:hypothetical protein [Blautia coccoides]MDT4377239.1 hypothetical protein [Blautia coccoides]